MEKEHCEGHSGTLALLQEHSKAIADLYDKHDDTMLLLNEIKLCTATMAMKLDNGFEQANKNISHLSDKIEKFQIDWSYSPLNLNANNGVRRVTHPL